MQIESCFRRQLEPYNYFFVKELKVTYPNVTVEKATILEETDLFLIIVFMTFFWPLFNLKPNLWLCSLLHKNVKKV